MGNTRTLLSFEQGVAHFERLFRIQPEAIAYDLHPNYLATRSTVERAERSACPLSACNTTMLTLPPAWLRTV